MKLGVQGILTIVEHRLDRHLSVEEAEALARAGADVRVRHVRNHIADTGLDALAALVGGGYGSPMVGAHTYAPDTVAAIDSVSPSGAFIGEMRLGAITSPPEPTDSDTGLYGPTAYSVRASLTEPRLLVSNTEDEVRFSCYLPAGFLSGHTITEEGIFTFDGDLFARIALDTPEVLGDAYGVQFIHRVRFATFLTLVPPPAILAGTIDISPDILGGLGSGRVIADIIDVSPEILGDLDVPLIPVWGINNADGTNNAGFIYPSSAPRFWYIGGGHPSPWDGYSHTYDYVRGTISSMMYRTPSFTRVAVRFDGTQPGVTLPPNYNRVELHVISEGSRILGFGNTTDGIAISFAGGTLSATSWVGGGVLADSCPFAVNDTLGLVLDSLTNQFRIERNGAEQFTLNAPVQTYFNALGARPDWNYCNIDYESPPVQRVDLMNCYDDPTVRV